MASPAVTNTFVNSTTASASDVNQNFTDIINGITDGTKDLSISALTCAGTATLNGNVTLGNASADDITFTGSLASTIPIKTTATYNIGSSTLGLAGIYFGANSQTVRIVGSGSMSATWTLTLPVTAGSVDQVLRSDGSGVASWVAQYDGAYDVRNLGITASVGSNALTVAAVGADGSALSSTNPAFITFRNSTATTGTPTTVKCTSITGVTVSSGSTLGHTSAVADFIYVYAINYNSGTVELAVSSRPIHDEMTLQTTTAEGGGGAADSANVLYSTSARSTIPIRLIGRLKSTQSTAGTWATAISEIAMMNSNSNKDESYSAVHVYVGNGHGSTNTKIRRYSTTNLNVGSAITYADSSTLGATFTINAAGLYMCTITDVYSGGIPAIGVSVNSTTLTTSIKSMNYTEGLRVVTETGGTNVLGAASVALILSPGDVVRAHTSGTPDGTGATTGFSIVKVG